MHARTESSATQSLKKSLMMGDVGDLILQIAYHCLRDSTAHIAWYSVIYT